MISLGACVSSLTVKMLISNLSLSTTLRQICLQKFFLKVTIFYGICFCYFMEDISRDQSGQSTTGQPQTMLLLVKYQL